jgi:CDP-diacylglycerol--glycerol-3-phosphate 3-phosphatidyltransferase
MLLTPIFAWCFVQGGNYLYLSMVIFTVAALTDMCDGYLARKYGMHTTLGAFLDPIADKILISTTLILFVYIDFVHWLAIAIIVIRDIVVTSLRLKLIYDGTSLVTSNLGKTKTVVQFATIFAMFTALALKPYLSLEHYDMMLIGINIMIWIMAAMTLHSGFDYLKKYFKFTHGAP